MTTVRTLKQERERRDMLCRDYYGDDHEYPVEKNFYDKYRVLANFKNSVPFRLEDCKKFDVSKVQKDEKMRYYKGVRTKAQCKLMNGTWSPKSINRDNFVDDGVCYLRPSDAYCGQYDNGELIRVKRRGKGYVWPSMLRQASNRCEDDRKCMWDSSLYECVSKDSFNEVDENRIPAVPSSWPLDMTTGDFQEYLRKYYLNMFDERPQSYMPLFGKGNRCIGYQKMQISQPQTVVNMVFKGLIKGETQNIKSNRGLLIWHTTGSGKTATAVGVMDAYWNTNKDIVFVSSIEGLASNPPEKMHILAKELFPRFKNMSNIKEEFEKRRVKFFTFAQLAHYLLINKPLQVKKEDEAKHKGLLSNAILIIDEVHNIFKPLPHQKSEHFALRDFLQNHNNPLTQKLHIAILTATPGDTQKEIVDLLNLVRQRQSSPIHVPKTEDELRVFGERIKGLVSYFNIGSDLSKYPLIKKLEPHKSPMTMTQYKKYVEAFRSVPSEQKRYDKLAKEGSLNKYYSAARKYSNTLYTMEENMLLKEFSSKLPILLDQVKKYSKEKHYIYSMFYENRGFGGHGALAIAKILENELGYEKLDAATARAINEGKRPMLSPGKKRYVLAITTELSADRHYSAGDNLHQLLHLFNRPENKYGDFIHVFIASNKYNEGVDMKAVRNIHIFEPFLYHNTELQTIGRGARYCSHKDLNIVNGEWVVRVHKYLADFPVELQSVDLQTLNTNLQDINNSIQSEESKLLLIKGKRGKQYQQVREESKKSLLDLHKQFTEAEKMLKEATLLDPSQYFMIDQHIEDQVREKTRSQLLLLTVMKQYAIDCKLFSKFHAQSGDLYNCKK